MASNPYFVGDSGGGTVKQKRPRRQRGPSPIDKQAAVFAAEQQLKPWEVPHPTAKKQPPHKPAPLDARYRAAIAAPVNAPVKVGKKTVPARDYLAATMSAQRRRQYHQINAPAPPHHDTSLVHAILGTPGSIAHNLLGYGTAAAKTGKYVAKQASGQGTYTDRSFGQALQLPAKQLGGPALYNAVTRGQTSHLGAALAEAALLPFPIKGLRALRAGRELSLPERVLEHTRLPEGATPKPIAPGSASEVSSLTAGAKTLAERIGTKGYSEVPPLRTGKAAEAAALPESTPLEQNSQQLIESLPQAQRQIREQNALRSRELGMRTREAQRRLEAGGFTEEAQRHANAALKGAMPTLRWNRFTEMSHETLDDMAHHIETHPDFQGEQNFFKRKNTKDALARIMLGNLPRPFEVKLLREAFGPTTTEDLVASVSFWKKNSNRVLNVIGIPRSLLSSFDLSAPLRQNLVFGVSHPIMWGKNFPKMVKAFGSTATSDQIMRNIAEDPNYDLFLRMKVPFTDLGSHILGREEMFASSYAETLTGGKYSPVRASNRAYVAFNNKARQDLSNFLLEKYQNLNPHVDLGSPEADKELRELGRLVGNATGRGKFPKVLEKSMPVLNATLFSPRLLASRLDVLGYPATVWTMNPVARREAIKQLGGLIGMVNGVLALAYFAGAKVVHDPRNADFGKVRVGNTRFDVAGGFLQPIRLASQLGPKRLGGGKIISSTTGKELSLTSGEFGSQNRLKIFLRFMETKESPPVGIIVNWSRGSDFAGKPFSYQREAYQRLVPLLAQDATEFYRQGNNDAGNAALAMAIYGIGMWGVGTQTYGPRKPKPSSGATNRFSDFSSGSTGDNPYITAGSGSSSSNPYFAP